MQPMENNLKTSLIIVMIFISLIPVAGFWFSVERIPYVTAGQARAMLQNKEALVLLIDTRDNAEYAKEHINGSINWPYEKIRSVRSPVDIPDKFKEATLLFLCDAGIQSASATQKLIQTGTVSAKNVKGGIQLWGKGIENNTLYAEFTTLKSDFRESPYFFPVKTATWFEQIMACAAAFAIKPAYMLLSFILIVILFNKEAFDQKLLKWAMICFLAGESFCALNYLFFGEDSYLVEYLHILGMVFAFGIATYSVISLSESRIMHVQESDKKCAALSVCPSCYKYQDTACGYIKILSLAALGLLFCCFIPLIADIRYTSYNTDIFGTFYNYSHPAVFQYFEIRYLPVAAMLLFGMAFVVFLKNKFKPTQAGVAVFSAGTGLFGFSLFRLILFSVYDNNLWWYIIWEEITEMIFITTVAILLWLFKDDQKE